MSHFAVSGISIFSVMRSDPQTIPVAERSTAKARGHSLVGIAGSNPAWDRADFSSRAVLQIVGYHCVWSRNVNIDVALARAGLLHQWERERNGPKKPNYKTGKESES